MCDKTGKYFPGVEDLDNWHGKPLGKQSAASLEAVKALIKDSEPHGLTPRPIKYDAPKIVVPTVKLNEPPNYKMGEKVGVCVYILVFVSVRVNE